MNQYKVMKEKHLQEYNHFPFFVAFSEEQLKDGLKRLGLKDTDMDKIVYVRNGVYTKKEDAKSYGDMVIRHRKELDEAIHSDKTGMGFILDMFSYELANHEYTYTREVDDTLKSLGYTEENIRNNPILKTGLELAIKQAIEKETQSEGLDYEYE